MADSPAERQRRSRHHKRGDHSLCDPTRCGDGASPTAVTDVTRNAVTGPGAVGPAVRLRARGQQLWRDLTAAGEPSPLERVVIEEACRLADRLDRFDAIVNGRDRAWLTLELGEDGVDVTVVVDKALSEARQQQAVLKQLVAELRALAAKGTSAAPAGVSEFDQLAARRRARRLPDAAGS